MEEGILALLVLSILLPVITIVIIGLRFYARKRRQLPLLVDDWLVLGLWVSWPMNDLYRFNANRFYPSLPRRLTFMLLSTWVLVMQISDRIRWWAVTRFAVFNHECDVRLLNLCSSSFRSC